MVEQHQKELRIRSKKVTHYITRAERLSLADDERRTFASRHSINRDLFLMSLIWNADQVGFPYELSNERILDYVGTRNVILHTGSQNQQRHSYTTMPMISRSGHKIGPLFICLYENSGRFGPRIQRRVSDLEQLYGNIRVVASKAMSKQTVETWIEDVLLLAKERDQPNDSFASSANETIIYPANVTEHLIDPDYFINDPQDAECEDRLLHNYDYSCDFEANDCDAQRQAEANLTCRTRLDVL